MQLRTSIVTYNLWRTVNWQQRQNALAGFLAVTQPDIMCVQELQAETRTFLDSVLPNHARVAGSFPGWMVEGNIYWDRRMFTMIECGAEPIGHVEEMRRLFWVRLWPQGKGYPLLVATSHLTFKATENELLTGTSPRVAQAHAMVKALDKLASLGDPVLLAGDFNDPSHPTYILNDGGYVDCFTALGLTSPPTAPTYKTSNLPPGRPSTSQTLDWIVSRDARAVAALVPEYVLDGVSPSDHLPVLAVYET